MAKTAAWLYWSTHFCHLQLFVGEDGFIGSLLEHSAADGPPAIMIDVFTLDLMYIHVHV